ncbi:MAG: tetratricopeptide repeat protein [Candidatus Omnitrophica bacterium]|nr:tetratricopeptide repeat protein [Candidatus Omnitrophota bacterium]
MRHLIILRKFELVIVFFALLGVSFIAYSNSLHNAFMIDDGPVFSDIKLNNIKFLPNTFFYPSLGFEKGAIFNVSDNYYRPVAHIIFLISYLSFGNNPFGYHIVNLILFSLMCFMVYIFIDLFFKNTALGLTTSLLFAVHPINVFYVDYITSTLHAVRFICMFLILICFLKALEGSCKYILYAASFICFVVALMCHETSIVLPFYVFFAGFYFKQMDFKRALLKSWPYWFILLVYLIFRFQCTDLHSTLPVAHMHPVTYLSTFSKIIYLYISKLFCPQGIVFFWNSPWMRGFNAFIWLIGLLALLGGWGLLLKRNSRSIIFFCVTWLLMGFIPVFLAAYPPYDKTFYGLLIEPQWVTFASVGFFIFISLIGLKLYSYWNKGFLIIFIILIVMMIALVRDYNRIWGDEYNYYFYWSQQIDPLPAINNTYLANYYVRKKEYRQARYYFSKALEKKPDASIYYNLGLIDAQLGSINQAREEFLLSVQLDPKFSSSYNNLGVIYFNQKDYKLAKDAFLKTIKLDKYCIEAYDNLGFIALLESNYKQAVEFYQMSLDIIPNEDASLFGLVQAYAGLNDMDAMNRYSRQLLAHGKDPNVLSALKKLLLAVDHKYKYVQ